MSTRSSIAVLQNDGKVKSVYCHWDGNLQGVGETLLNHYNSYERANALVALGGLSSVYENLNPLPAAPEAFPKSDVTEILTTHTFDRPQKDVTVAYHRDRKEKFEQQVHSSLEKYKKDNDFQSYNYLYMGGQWYFMSIRIKGKEWIKLTAEEIERGR